MARTKRSAPQEKKHRPYDQAAESRSAARSRVYDQAQEQPQASRRTMYEAYDDRSAVHAGERRSNYGQRTAAQPELLTDVRRRQTVRTGLQEVQFSVPVHRNTENTASAAGSAAQQPAEPVKKSGRNAKKRRSTAAAKKKVRPVRQPVAEEDDAPLPTVLRERGQASRRRARRRRTLLLSVMVLLLVGIWVLIAFVFKIGEIRVTGSSVYNQSVIVEHFGYREGDNLFTFNKRRTADQMLAALPYLETVKIRRQLPETVCIEVTASEEKYCFTQADGSTVITSPSFKVLRLGSNSGGLLNIRGMEIQTPVAGQLLEIPEEKQDALHTLQEVLTALEEGHIKNYSELDVGDPYAITLRCEDRFILQLGTTVELDYKLRLAAQTIYGRLEPDATGVIDVSGAGTSHAAYYRPQAID